MRQVYLPFLHGGDPITELGVENWSSLEGGPEVGQPPSEIWHDLPEACQTSRQKSVLEKSFILLNEGVGKWNSYAPLRPHKEISAFHRSCSVARLHPVTNALSGKGCNSAFMVVSPMNFCYKQDMICGLILGTARKIFQRLDLRSWPGNWCNEWCELRFRRRVIGLMWWDLWFVLVLIFRSAIWEKMFVTREIGGLWPTPRMMLRVVVVQDLRLGGCAQICREAVKSWQLRWDDFLGPFEVVYRA